MERPYLQYVSTIHKIKKALSVHCNVLSTHNYIYIFNVHILH